MFVLINKKIPAHIFIFFGVHVLSCGERKRLAAVLYHESSSTVIERNKFELPCLELTACLERHGKPVGAQINYIRPIKSAEYTIIGDYKSFLRNKSAERPGT